MWYNSAMRYVCPVCGLPLKQENRSYRCSKGHSFDIAASGYCSLYLSSQKKSHGDDAAMVKARTSFLSTGSYGFLKDALREISEQNGFHTLADLGCGEGYYTSALKADEKYGFDLSKAALKHAAKHDPSSYYAAASIFRLPLPDASMDAVYTCFAPCAKDEILRVLKPGGLFVFVLPDKDHLWQLKQFLYETPYENKVELPDISLHLKETRHISGEFTITRPYIMDLFRMTPYSYKTSLEATERLQALETLTCVASFVIAVYEKRL